MDAAAGCAFIVGAPRSGTTLLRNLFRQDPRFLCPEETHFFRWIDPCCSTYFRDQLLHNPTLVHHRQLDGISEAGFARLLDESPSREALLFNYLQQLRSARGLGEDTVFLEKTPQHVYSMAFIHAVLPQARFIHLVRSPLNVVTSLVRGRQFEPQPLQGAINFWREAQLVAKSFADQHPDRVMRVRYEDLTQDPGTTMASLYAFLREPMPPGLDFSAVQPAQDSYREHLDLRQRTQVLSETRELAAALGYTGEGA